MAIEELQELKRLALAATQGNRTWAEDGSTLTANDGNDVIFWPGNVPGGVDVSTDGWGACLGQTKSDKQAEADALFIAACDPATILALIAQLEQQASTQGVTDERAAFEAARPDYSRARNPSSPECYASYGIQMEWEGWQARAALSTQASAKEAPAVVDGRSFVEYALPESHDVPDFGLMVRHGEVQEYGQECFDAGMECARNAGAGQAVGEEDMAAIRDLLGTLEKHEGTIERCAKHAKAIRALLAAPAAAAPEGQAISVDVSTGEHDALHRVFGRLTGETASDGTWLAEMTGRSPAAVVQEPVAVKLADGIVAVARHAGIISGDAQLTGPQLLLLLDDIGNMLAAPPAAQAGMDAEIAKLATTVHNRIDSLCAAANTPDGDYFDAGTNLMIAVRCLLIGLGKPHELDAAISAAKGMG